jgi:competence protein ComEA
VRLHARRPDDADVIRARLRALLAAETPTGWVPDDEPTGADPEPTGPETQETDAGFGPRPLPPGGGRHRAPGTAVRLDPGRPGARALWTAAISAVVLLVGWTWLERPSVDPVPSPPRVTSTVPQSVAPPTPSVGEVAETASTVVVAVVGLVARPGLVTLPGGARVADAVEAAGGLLPDADPASVNLAAVVSDGQQIAVGVPGVTTGPAPTAGASADGPSAGPVNLNTATAAELDGLPGIGPVLAQRIVDHRAREGTFGSVGQLEDVPGIGPAILEGLSDAVTV